MGCSEVIPDWRTLVCAVGWSELPPWLLKATWMPWGGHSWLLGLRLDCPFGVILGLQSLCFRWFVPDSRQSLTLPSIFPFFLLKDQFFMVLVLIVFIVFKSVFLYVEGNNFLNTNRYYCIKLSWRSSCLINGHIKMVVFLFSDLPSAPEKAVDASSWNRPVRWRWNTATIYGTRSLW